MMSEGMLTTLSFICPIQTMSVHELSGQTRSDKVFHVKMKSMILFCATDPYIAIICDF